MIGRSSSTPDGSRTTRDRTPTTTVATESLDPVDVRGALYLPSRAFNYYQLWANYERDVIERDMGYAARLNLNAIRTWLNFEYWRREPEAHARKVEHLLSTAADNDIRVLVGLFDAVGEAPTKKRLKDTSLRTATAVRSPPDAISSNPDRWDVAREYVRWFMDRHRDDDRLLGIEAMNEPGWSDVSRKFTRGMLKTMRKERGTVPLTVGSTSVANDTFYRDWGSEIMQFHYNFPKNRRTLADALRQVNIIADRLPDPIWLTEWQRVRDARGFHSAPPKDQRGPDYASMAPVIHSAGIGNFFWSLMLKPAHVRSQRQHGILNGVFHEDGAVWSLEDARAIKAMSGDPSFDGEERKEWPGWAKDAKGGFG
ncbi:MAG: glycoside hydrolase [Salinigranum sp.]